MRSLSLVSALLPAMQLGILFDSSKWTTTKSYMYLLYYTSAMLLKNSRNVFLLKGVLAIDTVMVEERETLLSNIWYRVCHMHTPCMCHFLEPLWLLALFTIFYLERELLCYATCRTVQCTNSRKISAIF